MTDQTQQTLQALLVARQKLLHSYWHLIQIPLYDKEQVGDQDVTNFCQQLVDYTARWHMQTRLTLEPRLSRLKVSKQQLAKADERLLATLAEILVFDEFCTKHQQPRQHKRWHALLSALGEQLAKRFELEDWMLVKSKLRVLDPA